MIQTSLREKKKQDPISKIPGAKRTAGIVQAVEYMLPSTKS
jgi:hypothetical protein